MPFQPVPSFDWIRVTDLLVGVLAGVPTGVIAVWVDRRYDDWMEESAAAKFLAIPSLVTALVVGSLFELAGFAPPSLVGLFAVWACSTVGSIFLARRVLH